MAAVCIWKYYFEGWDVRRDWPMERMCQKGKENAIFCRNKRRRTEKVFMIWWAKEMLKVSFDFQEYSSDEEEVEEGRRIEECLAFGQVGRSRKSGEWWRLNAHSFSCISAPSELRFRRATRRSARLSAPIRWLTIPSCWSKSPLPISTDCLSSQRWYSRVCFPHSNAY